MNVLSCVLPLTLGLQRKRRGRSVTGMKHTTFEITPDLTASLTDEGYNLTVRSEKLDDYDTYILRNGDWELNFDSLSNKSDEAANIWDRPEFVAWANEMKRFAKSAESEESE